VGNSFACPRTRQNCGNDLTRSKSGKNIGVAYCLPKQLEQTMKILQLKQVIDITGLGRSSIYKYVSQGKFPLPLQLTERRVGWLDSEVKQWIQTRIETREVRITSCKAINSPEQSIACK
jgi:prophage regulatory protein